MVGEAIKYIVIVGEQLAVPKPKCSSALPRRCYASCLLCRQVIENPLRTCSVAES